MSCFKWCCIVAYTITLVYVVFFAPRRAQIPPSANRVHVIPFKNTIQSYYDLQKHSPLKRIVFFVTNFIGNLLLFTPLCFLLFSLAGKPHVRIIIIGGIALSVLIETIQYILSIGIFDIDDIILNTGGVFLGSYLWKKWTISKTKRNHEHTSKTIG